MLAASKFYIYLAGCMGMLLIMLVWFKHSRRSEVPLAIAAGIAFGIGAVTTKIMTASLAIAGIELKFVTALSNPILPCVIVSNVVGVVLLQLALQRGRAAVIIPMQLSTVNGIAVVAGIALFMEQAATTRVIGIVLILIGAFVVHFKRNRLPIKNRGNHEL